VSRLLEANSPTQATTALSNEMRQSVGELQGSQREMRLAVQDHTLQLKRFEESMTKTQETTERHAFELSELNEDVKSMHTLVKRVTGIMVTLLVALIVLIVVLLVRLPYIVGH
jgi:tRNA U34 5-carboxymethylaminomethyl modifying GTPase MnmE/TrmE